MGANAFPNLRLKTKGKRGFSLDNCQPYQRLKKNIQPPECQVWQGLADVVN